MRIRIVIAAIVAVASVAGCKPKEKKDDKKPGNQDGQAGAVRPAGAFLGANDFPVGDQIDKAGLLDEIDGNGSFVNDDPNDQDCTSQALNAAKVKATKTGVSLDADFDLASCQKSDFEKQGYASEVRKFRFKVIVTVSCDGDGLDYSSYDGRSYKEAVGDGGPFDSIKNATCWSFINALFEMDFEVTAQGSKFASKGFSRSATMTKDGQACRYIIENGIVTNDGCMELNYEDSTSTDSNRKLLETYTSRVLKSDRKDHYYRSGAYDFAIGGWTGTMTYTGANAAPTWTATKGSESASGTYKPDLDLKLTDGSGQRPRLPRLHMGHALGF